MKSVETGSWLDGAARDGEMRYRGTDDAVRTLPLEHAADLPLEDIVPFRTFPTHNQQRNMPGLYWFGKTEMHVPYESRLEMKVLKMLDFDPKALDVFAQPFELVFDPRKGGPTNAFRRHVPDFLVRRSVGTDLVVDVKPARRAEEPKTRRTFDLTRRAIREAGLDYEVANEPDPVLYANVEWLAAFRRRPTWFEALREVVVSGLPLEGGVPIGELVRETAEGCRSGFPEAVYRPVVYHLMWKQELRADLSELLSEATEVRLSHHVTGVAR